MVDSLVVALRSNRNWGDVRWVLFVVGFMAAVTLFGELLRGATSWIRTVQSELLKDHISGLIHERSVAADLAFYEWPEYYDHLHRAREEANYRPVALIDTVGSLLQDSITVIAMGAVLTYDQVLTSGQHAPELRLFDLENHFRSAFRALRERLRSERLKLARSQGLAELGAGAIALVISGGAMLLMVWRTINGFLTLGDLALFYQAFKVVFHLRARERLRDRAHYCARLAISTTHGDWAVLSLPSSLFFLYYLVRPFRLLKAYLRPSRH